MVLPSPAQAGSRFQWRSGTVAGSAERRIAHPHPEEAMALDQRIGAHAGRGIDRLLRGHEGAAPVGIVGQAVIAADHVVAAQPSVRERHQAVPAGVFQSHGDAVACGDRRPGACRRSCAAGAPASPHNPMRLHTMHSWEMAFSRPFSISLPEIPGEIVYILHSIGQARSCVPCRNRNARPGNIC